jgi:DNA-binding XRE family transcriptional regulator
VAEVRHGGCPGPFFCLRRRFSGGECGIYTFTLLKSAGKEVRQVLKEKKPELIEFGRKMLVIRKAKHMTQKELADALDIDYRVVSRYETGEAEMGVVLYQKMLSVFGVSSMDEQPQADTADLLQLWDELTPDNRQQLLNLAAMMCKAQQI